ncbi:hypothetical protein AOQ84DRAFT_416090 [Glonium stellatum]|uniref:Uncharacterized protein n=1 Tax=Glonium stellatum TaxID=574774 RepID=A0A8E2ETG6_9PEZI|nr:hypothetical protein AOQ84DRAFT_416090 [Glonium stellatum]
MVGMVGMVGMAGMVGMLAMCAAADGSCTLSPLGQPLCQALAPFCTLSHPLAPSPTLSHAARRGEPRLQELLPSLYAAYTRAYTVPILSLSCPYPVPYPLALHAPCRSRRAWSRASCVVLCRACAAVDLLSPVSTAGAGGLSLVYAPLRPPQPLVVGRPVPAGGHPLLNPSRLQLLGPAQSPPPAGIKLCGHLRCPSLRTRTAAVLVVLSHAAPLPQTSARLPAFSYTLYVSILIAIPSSSPSQFHPRRIVASRGYRSSTPPRIPRLTRRAIRDPAPPERALPPPL